MFILSEFQDIVRIEPEKFSLDTNTVIIETLNSKFANKVVHKVGLCICLFDITYVGDSYIFPGDGSSHTKVRFRFIVFRPFIDEVVVGKIRSSSPEGVRVSLGFFDDILIPPQSLQHPSRFDSSEQVWVWEYETEDGKNDMFMDEGEEIRFKVMEEIFVDISPVSAKAPSTFSQIKKEPGVELGASEGASRGGASLEADKKAPYSILGSVSESGLGLLSWWTTDGGEE